MQPECPFDIVDGQPTFRGLPLRLYRVQTCGRLLSLYALQEAADLLDRAEFATVFLEEDRAPYGLELWPAAAMLACAIEQDEPGGGRAAVEIGAGLGLASLAAALCGWDVTLTDREPLALAFAKYHASLNHIPLAKFATLDWNHPPAGATYDRVLAADVAYQLVDHVPLLGCIKALLHPAGVAIITDPNRGIVDRFPDLAAEAGFAVEVCEAGAEIRPQCAVSGRVMYLRHAR